MNIIFDSDMLDLFSREILDKAIGEGWEIILDKNTRGIIPVTSLIIGYANSDGHDAAQIETEADYKFFQKRLKEFAIKLGWAEASE